MFASRIISALTDDQIKTRKRNNIKQLLTVASLPIICFTFDQWFRWLLRILYLPTVQAAKRVRGDVLIVYWDLALFITNFCQYYVYLVPY